MSEDRAPSELDAAVDRAARAARAFAAVAHDAAREHVERDAVTPHLHRDDANVMPDYANPWTLTVLEQLNGTLDTAERERQARLRRWQAPPHPNRKGG